ncbi:MAG: chemotaxis response regulator protein-glutamate methylesterase [Candidatus Sericytochromatia bacterium]|nr:chemotaxis response regulator protein-glutamate methylesterase [Candidatus Sericytochromatia bacterium]
MKSIRVLIVDDSAFMRQLLRDVLSQFPEIKVVDTANNGDQALQKIQQLKPDVVTMDVEMPVMDGLTALGRIMKECPLPVVMVSSLTQQGADTAMRALEMGAVDCVGKPTGGILSINPKVFGLEIAQKIIGASQASTKTLALRPGSVIRPVAPRPSLRRPRLRGVIIGTSTGGPRALQTVLPALPANFPVPILIVQHMPPGFTASLAKRLNEMSAITVREAQEGDRVEPGLALVAPGDFHMLLRRDGTVTLSSDRPLWGVRPAVDMTLMSAVPVWGRDTLAVILTGMGHDGSRGVADLKRVGGKCIAESESTCTIYGMPRTVIEAGNADKVAPIHQIAQEIVEAVDSWDMAPI